MIQSLSSLIGYSLAAAMGLLSRRNPDTPSVAETGRGARSLDDILAA
jgi:hypothetical protein